MEKLNAAKTITCSQLCDFPGDTLDANGVSKKNMLKFQECAQNTVKVSNFPALTDHHRHFNPYMSRFCKQWETKMKTCTQMKPFVLITNYVTWNVTKIEKAFVGTTHKKGWFFYHNALSLMTAAQ